MRKNTAHESADSRNSQSEPTRSSALHQSRRVVLSDFGGEILSTRTCNRVILVMGGLIVAAFVSLFLLVG